MIKLSFLGDQLNEEAATSQKVDTPKNVESSTEECKCEKKEECTCNNTQSNKPLLSGPSEATLDYINKSSRKAAFKAYPNGREVSGRFLEYLELWDGEYNCVCDICQEGGEVLLCEFCNLVFHPTCFYPVMKSVPEGHWACPECSFQIDKLESKRSKKKTNEEDYESYTSESEESEEEEAEDSDASDKPTKRKRSASGKKSHKK